MRLLLDTHVLVWTLTSPDRLSGAAREMIEDPGNTVMVSAASAYEIELKRSRDEALKRVPEALERSAIAQGFSWLAIVPSHMVAAARLPLHHRDPWDRILIAQATLEDAVLITSDRWMNRYDVKILG